MSTGTSRYEIPTWVAGAIVALVTLSFAYGIIIRSSLVETVIIWLGMLLIGVLLFIVYLLYRFVVAFEKIAAKY